MNWHPGIPLEYRNQVVTGDARELSARLPDESVDLVLTDPPYGIGHRYANGYQDRPDEYEELLRWAIAETERVLKPGGLAFFFQAQPQLRLTWQWFPEHSRIFAACKNFVQIRPTAVQYAYDPVIFWQKEPYAVNGCTGRDWFISNTANMTYSGGLRLVPRALFHSCPRPADVCCYLVAHFCPVGAVVADFFAGSATTAVAAKLTGRRWVCFEQDPETAALARERVRLTPEPLLLPDEPEQQMMLEGLV